MNFKKILAAVLTGAMCLSMSMSTFADVQDEGIEPAYVISCPSGNQHNMIRIGNGHVYDANTGDRVWIMASTYYCEYCYEVIAVRDGPVNNRDPIGWYCIAQGDYGIADVQLIDAENFYYESGATMSGYIFRV